MLERLFALLWTANFSILGAWQAGRGRAGWVVFDAILAVIGIWIYTESAIQELKKRDDSTTGAL